MLTQHLDKDWRLRQEPLSVGPENHAAVQMASEGWIPVADLPCDIHVPLIAQGLIEEPTIGDTCFSCEWIEKRSWWFQKTFTADAGILASPVVDLVAEGLDAEADLYLNHTHLGHHRSQTYPFRTRISHLLVPGENTLLIRLTSGLERHCDAEVADMHDFIAAERAKNRGDDRRIMVRKPAYTFGWDWNPRIATCGITGQVMLEAANGVVLRDIGFTTLSLLDSKALVRVSVEVETVHPNRTHDLHVAAALHRDGRPVAGISRTVFATAGLNYVEMDLTIESPALWWPNGMGGQPLHTLEVDVETADGSDRRTLSVGIRTLFLDTSPIDDTNRRFRFVVNGEPLFAKGGNWETPDSIYARITDSTYETLVVEAKNANFNMFRFNGVGAYERETFYDACDRHGILIWNDFTFSCAPHPDDQAWFLEESEREVEHIIRRLRNHPSLALWCGSNECQWVMDMWGFWKDGPYPSGSQGGIRIFNRIMPRLVHELSPLIPYWNSSPFGGDDMNCNEIGDRHHWRDVFMSEIMDRRITPEYYDEVDCKFVSEFGCIGPPVLSTVQRYFGTEPIVVGGPTWELHTNAFEKQTVEAAIARHYHAQVSGLPLEDYLRFAGLFQGVTLGYAYESMRNARHNSGALLWSYNDCWGEIGWSIIDYYLTRKISYYFVRRALAHVCLLLREVDAKRVALCLNDTREPLAFTLECGFVSFDGDWGDVLRVPVVVPPLSRCVLATLPDRSDTTGGVFFARSVEHMGLSPATMRMGNVRELQLPEPGLVIENLVHVGTSLQFDVTARRFAHAVSFGLPDSVRLSDAYFDLLPGETRHIEAEVGEDFAPGTPVMPGSVHGAMLR